MFWHCFRSDGAASESQSQCCLDEDDSNSKCDDNKYEQPLVKYGELVILGYVMNGPILYETTAVNL